MRKIAAFFICTILAFSLGFSFLPESFNLLIGWLGPVFGTPLHVLLSMIFILFGDPLRFMTPLFIWVIVGVVCGLIVRKRLGSLSSAWLIYSAMFLVIVVAGLRLFEIVTDLGISQNPQGILTMLPPLPPGTTLGMVLSAPIVSNIYSALQGVSFTSAISPTQIISVVLGSVVLSIVMNLVILLVSSIVGCELGRLLEKQLFPKIISKTPTSAAGNLGASPRITRPVLRRVGKTIYPVFSLFFLALVVSAPISSAMAVAESNLYYAEGIIGFATPDGTAYLASAFVDSEMAFSNIDFSSSEFSDALMGILISHDTSAATLPPILTSPEILGGILPSEVPSELIQNVTRYYEIVPKTVFLTVYVDVDPSVARQRADIAASRFSSTFGAQLNFLAAFSHEVNLEEIRHNATFLVYQSMATLSEVAEHIMNALPTQRGGLVSLIDYAYQADLLTHDATSDSANGTVMTVGFFSSSMIMDMLESMESGPQQLLGLVLPNSTTPTPMLGVFSYWINWFHSSSFVKTFKINDILRYPEPITFSPEAEISLIATFVPNATIEDGHVVSQKPIVSIVTSADLSRPEFEPVSGIIQSVNETASVTITQASPGIAIATEDLTLGFTQVFPLNLRIEKVVSSSEVDIGRRINVLIRVVNEDADAAENVTLDDSLLLSYYGPWAFQLIEGNLTHEWAVISGNSTATHSYSILLKNEGFYTLPSAELTYDYVDQSFVAKSNFVYVKTRSPSAISLVLEGIPASWGVLERSINKIPGLQGSGSLILTGTTLIVIAPLAFLEYRNVRKWLKKRKETP